MDGKNYPLNRELPGPHTPGAWRAETTGGQGRTRRFLTWLVTANVQSAGEERPTVEPFASGLIVKDDDLAIVLGRTGQQVKVGAQRTIHVDLAI